MATEAKNTNYWISSSALYIQLNAMGEPDYIQCSVVSGASILCYMQGIPGLEYDAGHNYQRWPLAAYPSIFPDSERKYIYVAIPRVSTADNNTAIVVYPSERIDLYGYSIANPDKLVGDERFYYIYLQGIISEVKTDADGKTRKRDWLQHVDCGKLNTDESLSSGIEGTWWKYNSVTDTITFLKTILSATFDSLTANIAKITKLFLGDSELNGVADDSSLETDHTKVVTPLYLGQFGVKHFLAKDKDDVAHGTITFEKVQKFLAGLNVGDFNLENGGSWNTDAEGRSHLITDYLEVRMKAIFEELVIKKTSTIGGKEIISPAGGVVAHKVETVTVTYNGVSQKAYRCYFLAEQDGDEVDNDFAVNDQVRSESFNVRKGTYHKVGNHFYWRLVIGRDEDPVELEGKKYHYIDLSDTDCATASDVPAKGDVLSQCGNRTDVERQNCLIFAAVDTYSPSIGLYHGINSYSFAKKEFVEYGVNKQTNKAFFYVYGDMYVGDRPTKENGYEGSSYVKYDSATKQVVIKGKLSAKSTVDGKELSQYIKENSEKGLTEEQVNNLINNSQVIADLQNQVDGAIETWFYEGVPTLKNAPAISWTTDKDKKVHLGDLYYDNKTGKAYRFAKDGNTYKWTIITDTDIAKALSDASKAQETADGKMTVFSAQPTPPYQVGDIWVNATYPSDGSTYKNEVLRCQTDKKAGSQFTIGDWIKASKYTDDTVANAAKKAAEDAQRAAQTAQTDFTNLEKTVNTNKMSFDNYVKDGYLEPSEIAAMAQDSKRLEDDFAAAEKSYNEVKDAEVLKDTKQLTDLTTAFATTLTTAKTELVTYLADISARYNAADTNGKATIVSAVGTKFTNFQSAYASFYDKLGLANAYITSKLYGDLCVVIGDVTSLAYLKKALIDAPDTEINGGLVLSSLIGLRDTDGNTTAGINGITEKSAKGGGIAAWFGGEMVDKDYNDGSKTPANTIFRFDGSGYVAGGAIWWGTDGRVHADPTSFIVSKKNLGAYLTFFEPTWKAGSAGTSVADLVSLKPNAPFTKLGVSGDASFEGAITFHGIDITYDSTNKAIKIDGNLYATGGITAYGASDGAGGGGGLNGSVKSYSEALKLTSESLSEIASAYSIKQLSARITSLEGGSATSISVSGSGNAVTSITKNGTTISVVKGSTFLTSHQSLAGYATQSWVNGKGYITSSGSITGNAATATKLQTSRSIWGQNFDGTGNIDGTLQIERTANFGYYNEGIRIVGKSNEWSVIMLGCKAASYSGCIDSQWGLMKTDSDTFRIGRGSSSISFFEIKNDGYVGIGTKTPTGRLDVNGELYVRSTIYSQCGNDTKLVIDNTDGEKYAVISFREKGVEYSRITIDGRTNEFYFSGYINSKEGYKKTYSSDDYVLLGGGGHKTISSLSVNYASSAGNADTLDGYHATSGNNKPWGTIPVITPKGGYMDIGKHLEFHYDNTTGSDYSTALMCTGNHSNIVNLPSRNGMLALTSDIPTKVSSLSNDSGYITSSGSCAYATSAGNADKVDGVHVTWQGALTSTSHLVAWEDDGSALRDLNPVSLKLSQFTDDILSGKYLPLSGGIISDSLTVNEYIFAYRNRNSRNLPAIIFDKIGSHFTGIGGCDETDTIYFGAVNTSDKTWNTDYRQIWMFNGRISHPSDTYLYLGRQDNAGWVACQDICSESGYNTWAIFKTTGNAQFAGTVTVGNLLSKGGVTAYSSSDIRLKHDLRKLDYFGIIKMMGGTYGFAWKKDNTRSIGWIAQHVLCNPHLKDIVETDDNGYYKINYWSPKLIATAFGAIEQVGDEVSRLKARVVFLESEVQRLSESQGSSDKKRLDNKNINLLN